MSDTSSEGRDGADGSPAEHSLVILNEEGLTHEACFFSVLNAALPEIFSKEESDFWGIAVAGFTDASHSATLPAGVSGGNREDDQQVLYERLHRLLADAFDATEKSWPLKTSEDLSSYADRLNELVRLFEVADSETSDGCLGFDITRSWIVVLMAALTKDKRHRALILESCSVKGPHAFIIGKMLALNKSITELYLNDNEIGHGGSQGLKLIMSPPPGSASSRLAKLWLVNNGLNEEDGKVIGEALAREGCQLHELALSDNYLGAAGAAFILEGLASNPSSRLEDLSLDDNAIGDDDEELLDRIVTALQSMPESLTRLDVAVNGISRCDRVVEAFPKIITEANVTCTVTYEGGSDSE